MKNNSKKNLVCFDTAYSLAQFEAGGLEIFTEEELLNGYFNPIFVINIAFNKDDALKVEQSCYDELLK